ncbi:MAG: single-stranded-DNA-specific exonuclease RecJ [bacterium]|nr:single-stranded-DNA-specific exonuclease RecJ [bacterium]
MEITTLLYNKNISIGEKGSILEKEISESFNIDSLIAGIMVNRGIKTIPEGKKYLYPKLENLSDPYSLKGMDISVARICKAIKNRESILIYGDYDVDGITSVVILKKALGGLTEVGYYIPDRITEGYGLNKAALSKISSDGYSLVITVDCGITSVEEIAFAKTLGLEIIILDHHQPLDILPDTEYIVDPKQIDCLSGISELAGVGVIYMLINALRKKITIKESNFLEFAALGTIADMAPLIGENRILVKNGLEQINSTDNPGLKALINQSGLSNCRVDTGHVSFMLAPKINASGRIGTAKTSVELLLTGEQSAADSLANQLCRMNEKRQIIEADILKDTISCIENEIDLENEKIIVLDSKKWHPGVIGIVASKMVERFSKPVILIAHDEKTSHGKGSARSKNGLNIFKAISECKDLLLSFGGHELAAGLSIEIKNIGMFRKKINEAAENIFTAEKLLQKWNIDAVIDFKDLNLQFIDLLENLAPFGFGNPKPVFMSENVSLMDYPRIVGINHVKLKAKKGNIERDIIGFNMINKYECLLNIKGPIHIIYNLSKNLWQNKTSLQLELKDILVPQNP